MQELIIDKVVKKEASKPGGNPFFIVYGEDGEEMTSFDTAIAALGKGSRINVEPKVKGKHVNIAKWELIEAKEGHPGPSSNGGSFKRDTAGIEFEYRLKAQLQYRERHSIESQTVFNGVISILTSPVMKTYNELPKSIKELVDKALNWGIDTLTISGEPAAPVASDKKEDKKAEPGMGKAEKALLNQAELPEFKDGVELVNHALKMGWRMHEIRQKLNIKEPSEIKDVQAAAAELFPPESPP